MPVTISQKRKLHTNTSHAANVNTRTRVKKMYLQVSGGLPSSAVGSWGMKVSIWIFTCGVEHHAASAVIGHQPLWRHNFMIFFYVSLRNWRPAVISLPGFNNEIHTCKFTRTLFRSWLRVARALLWQQGIFHFLVAPCCSQGATLQVTLRCRLSGGLCVCPSVAKNFFPLLLLYAFLDVSCHPESSKEFSPQNVLHP